MARTEEMKEQLEQIRLLATERGLSSQTLEVLGALDGMLSAIASGDRQEMVRAVRTQMALFPDDAQTQQLGERVLAAASRDERGGPAAIASLRSGVEALRSSGDPEALTLAFRGLARAVEDNGGVEQAQRVRREEALPALRELGHDRGCLEVLGDIGRCLREQGRLEEACRLAREEMLPLARRIGDDRVVLECLLAWWAVQSERRDHEAMLAQSRDEILPLAASLDDGATVAVAALGGATALVALSREGEARQWLVDVGIPAADHCGDAALRVKLRHALGETLAFGPRPDLRGAKRTLREAARIAEEAGLDGLRSEVREVLRTLPR
jgi:hypothetical protein